VEGASDGCRPKLHRWPFSVSHFVPRSTSQRGLIFSFDSIGSKKDPGKLVLREESVCRGLHSMSALTPYLKIVAIVCAISAYTPVK
jgi:hypothetical protein